MLFLLSKKILYTRFLKKMLCSNFVKYCSNFKNPVTYLEPYNTQTKEIMIENRAGIYAEQATVSVVWTFPKYLPHGPIPDA